MVPVYKENRVSHSIDSFNIWIKFINSQQLLLNSSILLCTTSVVFESYSSLSNQASLETDRNFASSLFHGHFPQERQVLGIFPIA